MKKNQLLSFFVATMVVSAAIAPALLTHGGYVPPVMNLTGSANGATSVTLSWDTPQFTDAVSFDVEYSLTQNGAATAVSGAPTPIAGTHQSFNVTGLTQNTTYYFSVRMIDSTGTGSLPKYVTVTTAVDNGGGGGGGGGGGTTTVPPVMNLVATAQSQSRIDLSWDTPLLKESVSFEIVRSFAPLSDNNFAGGTAVTCPVTPISNTHQTCQVNGLMPGTLYYFGIRLVNTTGVRSVGAFASAITASVPPPMPVPPVTNLTAVALDTTHIKLTWNTPNYFDLTSFDVACSLNPITDANFSAATPVPGAPAPIASAAQMVTASNLTPNTLYYCGVRVVNSSGARSVGAFASATTLSGGGGGGGGGSSVPMVANLTATALSANTVKLTWNTPVYATLSSFEIVYSQNPITDLNFTSASPVYGAPTPASGAAQTVTVVNLNQNTLYYFGIRIVNTANARSLGAFASATTLSGGGGGNGAVPPVMNLAANPGQTYVDVSWDTPQYTNTLVRFELRYSTAPMNDTNFGSATLASGVPSPVQNTSQGVRVSGLTPSTLYYFGIVVFDSRNVASRIVYTSTTTLAVINTTSTVPMVANLSATPKDQNTITLAWDTPNYPSAARFELIDSTSTVNDASFATLPLVAGTPTPAPSTHQTMDVAGLNPNTLYYFGIRIVNTANARSLGAFASATTLSGGGGGGGGGGGNGGGGGGGGGTIGFLYNWVPPAAGGSSGAPSITINGGAATTENQLVNLSISANNCSEIMLSNNADFTGATWETFMSTTRWILSDGNGVKTVYGKCRTGSVGSASITLNIPANAVTVSLRRSPAISIASGEGALISIAPNLITIPDKGDVVVVLTAHPNGVAYGARAELSYPIDSLELAKVEYGTGWVPQYGTNTNVEDAVYGTMVKSAYFPGGFSSPKHFATLTFHARNAGTGRIDVATRNERVIPGIAQTTGTGVVGNDVGRVRYLAANMLSVAGEGDHSAFMVLLGLLVIIYMIYLAGRDKRRHGKAFTYHGFRRK